MDDKTKGSNRLTLLLLLLVFLAPALGSWLLYLNAGHLHLGTTNKGEFVQPPRLIDVSGLTLPRDFFAHHLTLVYVGGHHCATDCLRALQLMRVTELALGEQMAHAQRLFLAEGAPDEAAVKADPGLMALDANGQPALRAFDGTDAPEYVYLVDPHGYVVLRYSLNRDPKFILQDLRHLLGQGEG